MKTSPKIVMIYVLLMICINHLSAQYITNNFSPSSLISDGLKAPGRMAVDTNDYIYVTDAIQKNVVKYDGQGNYIATITTTLSPLSIAINNKNQLFIGDESTGSIYNVSPNGSKTLFYEGTSMPNSMVFGLNNILYIVDSRLKKVIGLDVSGTVVKEFTYDTFTFPTGIAFDKQNNHIIVSEHGGIGEDVQTCGGGSMSWGTTGPLTTIYIFDIDGNLIKNFGCFGTKDGLFHRIQGITVGTCGNIYAVDPYLGRVSVFDPDGNFITKFGTQGDGTGEFNIPTGIVFSKDNRTFISSMNKGAIDVYSITFSLPTSTITSADQTVCSLEDASIEVQFTGTAPWTFTYTVNDLNPVELVANESLFNIPLSSQGLYKIIALTDGVNISGTCFTGSANILISDAPPTATILTTDLSKCTIDDSSIKIQLTGTAPWTFAYTIDGANQTEITTNQNLYTLNVEQSGFYEFLNLTDDACVGDSFIGSVSVIVNPLPSASINFTGNQILINPGESADIDIYFTGSSPYTFTYIRDEVNSTSITTSDNPYTLTVIEKGTYEIISMADLNCTNTNWQCFFDISFYDIVPPTATLVTSDFYLCSEETANLSIDFTGEAPWTFSYTMDGVNPVEITTSDSPYLINVSSSGVYELSTVSDQNTTGTFSGTSKVVLLEQPIVNLPEDINICEGDPVYILDAGGFETYLWSDGSTGRTLEVSANGIYSVTVTDASGCTASDSVSVTVLSLPDAYFYYDVNALEVQFVNNSFNADSHYWDFGDGTSSTEENPIHDYASKGTYNVTYTALSNYCGSSVFTETVNVGGKSLNEIIDIYPNPSTGKFTISLSPNEPLLSTINILINSTSGQYLYSETFDLNMVTFYNGNYYIDVNIDRFTKGIYIVYIDAGNFVGQDKLILKD